MSFYVELLAVYDMKNAQIIITQCTNRTECDLLISLSKFCMHPQKKVFRIGTVRYNWPMSAHASQDFRIAHCTDSEDLPPQIKSEGGSQC